jgi:hypothetical protein
MKRPVKFTLEVGGLGRGGGVEGGGVGRYGGVGRQGEY